MGVIFVLVHIQILSCDGNKTDINQWIQGIFCFTWSNAASMWAQLDGTSCPLLCCVPVGRRCCRWSKRGPPHHLVEHLCLTAGAIVLFLNGDMLHVCATPLKGRVVDDWRLSMCIVTVFWHHAFSHCHRREARETVIYLLHQARETAEVREWTTMITHMFSLI